MGISNRKYSTLYRHYQLCHILNTRPSYLYDLAVPESLGPGEEEKFKPKPLDGEVELFEVSPSSKPTIICVRLTVIPGSSYCHYLK